MELPDVPSTPSPCEICTEGEVVEFVIVNCCSVLLDSHGSIVTSDAIRDGLRGPVRQRLLSLASDI